MGALVHVAISLRAGGVDPQVVEKAIRLAGDLGLTLTARGRVSLSFVTSPESFESAFRVRLQRVPSKGPDGRGFGSPAGFVCDEPIQVPDALREAVSTISVVPPAERLS